MIAESKHKKFNKKKKKKPTQTRIKRKENHVHKDFTVRLHNPTQSSLQLQRA